VFAAELAELEAQGLIDVDAVRVRLTARGLFLGNQVFARFLPDEPAGDLPPLFEPLMAGEFSPQPS
jgi:hypothetical protein